MRDGEARYGGKGVRRAVEAANGEIFAALAGMDATNQQVAKRRFPATDYLRTGTDTSPGLATDVYLPVLLELGDPGEQAVGFEIAFF